MKALNIEDYNRTIDYVLEFSKKTTEQPCA